MSDLQKWFAEYAELMYPTEQQAAGKSQHELDGMAHTGPGPRLLDRRPAPRHRRPPGAVVSAFRIEDLFEPLDDDPNPVVAGSLDEVVKRYGFDEVYAAIQQIITDEEER
jgi:hypothetical protein